MGKDQGKDREEGNEAGQRVRVKASIHRDFDYRTIRLKDSGAIFTQRLGEKVTKSAYIKAIYYSYLSIRVMEAKCRPVLYHL